MNSFQRLPGGGVRTAIAAAVVAALVNPPAVPRADAHGGAADGTRPFVTGVEPAIPGVVAEAVFTGDWQVQLISVGTDDVAVLDEGGRPFVRIGRSGAEGDYGAPAWYQSAVVSTTADIVKLPEGVTAASPPDWRPVTRARAWAWYDRRLKAEPGAVTPDMVGRAVPVRLGDFTIPLLIGGRPAVVRGYIEFEPPRGRYVHELTGGAQPAPGVEVGLLDGQAVPTLTVRNDSAEAVTVLGADGEPFLRISDATDVNLASPTWVQVGRALGRTPRVVADPAVPPRWERIGARRASWADFRSRPPDTEPEIPSGGRVAVKRWTIPLRVGERPVEVTGVTSFESLRPPGQEPEGSGLMTAAAGVAGGLLVAGSAAAWFRRRGSRSLR